MRQRCSDINAINFKNYGGRGIRVCEEWNDYRNFEEWALNSGYNDDLTIDRIDNDGPYSPANCRWSSVFVQANNKRNNRLVEINGNVYTLAQLSEQSGINPVTISQRIKRGWPVFDAVTVMPKLGRNQFSEDKSLFIKVKYHTNDIVLEKIPQGDWIDLKAAENCCLQQGEFKVISLGISCRLPIGYEAHIVPRSSTFRRWGIIQTNGIGIVDESYCGNDDVWGMPVYATRPTTINKGDRICQFRIVKKMEPVEFVEVAAMEDPSRGGFGSTGAQ